MVVTFLVHLLCAIVSCAPNYGYPYNDIPNEPMVHKFRRELADLREPMVLTSNGALEGYVMKTIRGRGIYAFQGVPYGEPPVGRLRFMEPVPARTWNGILKAKSPSPLCLQIHFLRIAQVMGNEDCLYLDVYTPKLPSGDVEVKLPVIIFLHGGSFTFSGAQEYGPAYLLEQDVVLVAVNYRVGVLGFLSTGDETCPGNNGLKDQALAIKWVHENVGNFGGDPSRITLLGQSAGAASAHLHMMSDHSKKYLNSAISLSGSGFNYWSVTPNKRASDQMKKLAGLVRCPSWDSRMLLNCLRQLDPVFVVNSQRHMADWRASELLPVMYSPQVIFGPVVEPSVNGAFLIESPDEAYDNDHVAKIPWISTILENEGNLGLTIVEGIGAVGKLKQDWNRVAKYVVDYRYLFSSDAEADALTEKINRFYFGNRTAVELHSSRIGDILTDRYFSFAHLKSLKKHSQIAPTYGYLLKYKGRFGSASTFNFDPKEFGVSHADDAPLIFNASRFSKGLSTSDEEFGMTKLMTSLIANFADVGEPMMTVDEFTKRTVRIWDPVLGTGLPEDMKLLQLDLDVRMVENPFLGRIEFWKSLNLPDMVWT